MRGTCRRRRRKRFMAQVERGEITTEEAIAIFRERGAAIGCPVERSVEGSVEGLTTDLEAGRSNLSQVATREFENGVSSAAEQCFKSIVRSLDICRIDL